MPLLAAGRASEEADVCVFLDAWNGSPHLALLAEARSAVAAAKGSLAGIPGPVALSLVDALISWQQAFHVRFILVFDRFEEFLGRPVDEIVLEFHQQLVDVLNESQLRINVLISIDEQADSLLAPLRDAVPGFGEATLRLEGRRKRMSGQASSLGKQSIAHVFVGSEQPKPSGGAAEDCTLGEPVSSPDAQLAGVARSSGVFGTATHPQVEGPLPASSAESLVGQGEATETHSGVGAILPADTQSPADPAVKRASRVPRFGWFALVVLLLSLSALSSLWLLMPRPKARPTPPEPQALPVQASPVKSPESIPATTAVAPAASPVKSPESIPARTADAPAAPVPSRSAAQLKPAGASTTKKGQKVAGQGTSMVYIHVRNQAQRARAETFSKTLAKRGIRVSGIKVVPAGPSTSDLRYFRKHEARDAAEVARALRDLGIASPRLTHIGGHENTATPRQYELWLAPVNPDSDR